MYYKCVVLAPGYFVTFWVKPMAAWMAQSMRIYRESEALVTQSMRFYMETGVWVSEYIVKHMEL